MSRSIGVLGGAFNPPHIGHMVLAEQARFDCGFDELIVVPTGQAAHKRIHPEPGPEVRLELARAAFEGVEGVTVSDLETRREGPSYAFRTLELLAEQHPGTDLSFVMGADTAAGITRWEQPERVVELARVAVAARPGASLEGIDEQLESLGHTGPAQRIRMPEIGVSSTLVRQRIAAGEPVRWLVGEPVREAIAAKGLYREGSDG